MISLPRNIGQWHEVRQLDNRAVERFVGGGYGTWGRCGRVKGAKGHLGGSCELAGETAERPLGALLEDAHFWSPMYLRLTLLNGATFGRAKVRRGG
jgi:hypothetical protein